MHRIIGNFGLARAGKKGVLRLLSMKHRLGITKAGNSHLRQLLIEASSGICKGAVGHKSKELRARQNGNTAEFGYHLSQFIEMFGLENEGMKTIGDVMTYVEVHHPDPIRNG